MSSIAPQNDHSMPSEHSESELVPVSWRLVPPEMPWDKPIELEILKFVRDMKINWEMQSRHNIWPSVRKEAQAYMNAYTTVEKQIVSEMELRAKIKADTKENAPKKEGTL
jgi:hypothetical protein